MFFLLFAAVMLLNSSPELRADALYLIADGDTVSVLRRTLYPLGQQRNAPCALSGRRGRKVASTACRDAKICKFDFLKIHLLKFIYVNLIF